MKKELFQSRLLLLNFLLLPIIMFSLFLNGNICFAVTPSGGLEATGAAVFGANKAPFAYADSNAVSNPVLAVINKAVKIILGLIGAITFVLFVYSGFLWMTAHGNDTQVKKAQTIMSQATLGLIVVLLSYALVSFVIVNLGYSV